MGYAFLFSLMILYTYVHASCRCPVHYLYQIGDSLADTGNLIRIPPLGPLAPAARLPYGETFPGFPTGRWSDGRLIIDFTAMAFGLPLLNPFLDTNASFKNGVDFAVAGSTALSPMFLASRGIITPAAIAIPTLSDQVVWFASYLESICWTPKGCAKRLRRSLVFLGRIGGNDINFGIINQTIPLSQIEALVPFINQAIANATREVISRLGAKQIAVPGNFPIGCLPYAIYARGSNVTTDYDELGCLRSLNNISIYENSDLQLTLSSLRREFPRVNIFYLDYYNAFLSVLRNAASLGFNSSTLLEACCGEPPYNFLTPQVCGSPGVPLCPNPNTYISWDGVHLTEQAYRSISQILIPQIFMKINCKK